MSNPDKSTILAALAQAVRDSWLLDPLPGDHLRALVADAVPALDRLAAEVAEERAKREAAEREIEKIRRMAWPEPTPSFTCEVCGAWGDCVDSDSRRLCETCLYEHTVERLDAATALVMDLANALDAEHVPAADGIEPDNCEACAVLKRAREWEQ